MDQITIYTLNTKGLNVPEKRRMLLNDLKRSKADVAFIQETHFKTGAPMCLKNRYFPTTYHATNPSAKSKGVSILISGNVPWTCRDTRIDTEGRYVFLKGLIGDVLVTLATVYAPNDRQDLFISKTLNELLSFAEGQLMLGGDFNVPLCPSVDTSNGTSSLRRGVHNRITKTLHETRLIDVWRLLHARERDYTFFSSPHKSYSCIDLFLLPHNQLEAIDKVDIGTITWSDHAPITLKYSLSRTATTKSRFWRLNESLLQDPTVLADVTKELKFYFQTNDIDNCDPGILWEAHKSVIRGILIKHGAHIKREREKQLLILLQKTHDLEKTHKQNPTTSIETELLTLCRQTVDILQYQAKAALQACRKLTYESGNKCGKILARAVRQQRLPAYIAQIISPSGQKRATPMQIADEFKNFYSFLYNLPKSGVTDTAIREYLTLANTPKLSAEDAAALEEPITMAELQGAIKNMKPGKAPGPDGLTLQYYQTLLPILGPRMLKLFNKLTEGGHLQRDTLSAHISPYT